MIWLLTHLLLQHVSTIHKYLATEATHHVAVDDVFKELKKIRGYLEVN
jgi:hypothetical protein